MANEIRLKIISPETEEIISGIVKKARFYSDGSKKFAIEYDDLNHISDWFYVDEILLHNSEIEYINVVKELQKQDKIEHIIL